MTATKLKLLILSSSPESLRESRAGEESRAISNQRGPFDVRVWPQVRFSDLERLLRDFRPQLLHFCGHGNDDGELLFVADDGQANAVGGGALAAVLGAHARTLRCVVFSACYSADQAEQVAKQIDAVIGVTSAISAADAIAFSTGFYSALGDGENLSAAFEAGARGIGPRSKELLQIHMRDGVYAQQVVISRALSEERPRISTTRLPHWARKLFGREAELEALDRAWEMGVNVVSVVAWGGVGKTSLVNEWRNRMIQSERGVDLVFDWSFYSQGTRERGAVSADDFLREALRFVDDQDLSKALVGTREQAERLADSLSGRRSLLILDGLEPLQHPEIVGGRLKVGAIGALLRRLAQQNRGLCVVTTRQPVRELEMFESTTAERIELEHLDEEAGAELLQSLFEAGRKAVVPSSVDERKEISRAAGGHALTLQLLGSYVRNALGAINRWREIDFERADEELGGHAFRVMSAYVRWLSQAGGGGVRQLAVLRLLGLFDRPADPGCLQALRREPAISDLTESLVELDEPRWRSLVSSLEAAGLVTRGPHEPLQVRGFSEASARDNVQHGNWLGEAQEWPAQDFGPAAFTLDAHPLVREYFAKQLQREGTAAWREGHLRLYEHLCDSVPYWPEGVDGLTPLYQAITHGCLAGEVASACEEVYFFRIQRWGQYYSRNQLGLFGADLAALACFFERPWDRLASAFHGDRAQQAWLFSEASAGLRAAGRVFESLEPKRASLSLRVELEDWKNATISAGNLSEHELVLGEVSDAVAHAKQSVEYAERSKDADQRMASRAILANALFQAGDIDGAREFFEQGEAIQGQISRMISLLHAIWGHWYCELLLHRAERQAWRHMLGEDLDVGECVEDCVQVFARATRMERWVRRGPLVDLGMNHLTLSRAALYGALLQTHVAEARPESELSLATARQHLAVALTHLYNADQQHHLPCVLVTRAWIRCCDSEPQLAHADLDEALYIAEQGSMRLDQVDIDLHRARLFRDREALARSRTLMTRHAYDRRKGEFTDAHRAARQWPT